MKTSHLHLLTMRAQMGLPFWSATHAVPGQFTAHDSERQVITPANIKHGTGNPDC